MAYITQSDVAACVEPGLIVQALDDDKDGAADEGRWEQVLAAVEGEINGVLAVRYTIPFSGPVPAAVKHATLVLTAEALYLRRGMTGDQNPWTARARDVRERLARIAAGDEQLSAAVSRVGAGGAAIVEPSKTHEPSGRLMT